MDFANTKADGRQVVAGLSNTQKGNQLVFIRGLTSNGDESRIRARMHPASRQRHTVRTINFESAGNVQGRRSAYRQIPMWSYHATASAILVVLVSDPLSTSTQRYAERGAYAAVPPWGMSARPGSVIDWTVQSLLDTPDPRAAASSRASGLVVSTIFRCSFHLASRLTAPRCTTILKYPVYHGSRGATSRVGSRIVLD